MSRIFAGLRSAGTTTSLRRPRTPTEILLNIALAGIASYSTFALISHHLIAIGNSDGPSMFPTMPTSTSLTVYSRRHRHGRNIKAGDVIIFENPVFLRGMAIKRVIGMPGDYVVYDPAQSPTVGGAGIGRDATTRATETSTSTKTNTGTSPPPEPTMIQVPEGHVWVAGDNLAYSRDSRFYGPLPMALILGKCLYNGDGWFSWRDMRGTGFQPVLQEEET